MAKRKLRLFGADNQPGLSGGASPENEGFTIKFLGTAQPGADAAMVRIVTQAANLGVRSASQESEPAEAMYYLDLPVTVRVRD